MEFPSPSTRKKEQKELQVTDGCRWGLYVVPEDEASNDIVFVCRNHFLHCLKKELGIHSTTSNSTYSLTSLTKGEI